jgi:uridine monophosphate synthetase
MSWEDIKENFIQFIIDNKVVGFLEQPIKLKSGRFSNFYVNWRTIAEDVYLFDQLTDYLISYTKNLQLEPNCFYGVPEGATKLGLITQYKWAKSHKNYNPGVFPLAMGRGKPKNHGESKDRYFLGIPKGNIVIVEDVSTTGTSLINTVKNLINQDVNIIAIIALTNREEIRNDGKYFLTILEEMGLKYHAMSNVIDLLPRFSLNSDLVHKIESYYKKYGIREKDFNISS